MSDGDPEHRRPTVVVFARRPVPGTAKTRIAAHLGVEATHRLYEAMLADTFAAVAATGLPARLVHTPGPWPDAPMPTAQQEGASFAERFAHALTVPAGPVVLVGADTPHVDPGTLREAAAAAMEAAGGEAQPGGGRPGGARPGEAQRTGGQPGEGHVVVPSRRGGFSLYAAARPWTDPAAWSLVFAAADEVTALRARGARVLEPAVADLDTVADLRWLRDEGPPGAAPATVAVLRDLGGLLDEAVVREAAA